MKAPTVLTEAELVELYLALHARRDELWKQVIVAQSRGEDVRELEAADATCSALLASVVDSLYRMRTE
jgi:hypothetical protein